jgi:amino acid adenylation domain-containing protein
MMVHGKFIREDYINSYWKFVQQTIDECGEKEFFVSKNNVITYAEVNRRGNVIFASIQEKMGGKTGQGIGLFMNDHARIIPAMIGVLKSRNYFAPLDVNDPESTLRYVLDNAEIKIILTVDAFFDQIHSLVGDRIAIVNLDALDFEREVPNPEVNYSPDDVVQILFTSGSTGQPKGAIENYRYLGRSIYHKVENRSLQRDDRVVQLSTFAYSGLHILVFTALAVGYTIYYYDVKADGFTGLPEWIHEHDITVYRSTATLFRGFVSTLSPEETFPSVTTAHVGSEKRLQKDIQDIRKFFPNVKRIQLGFASTETQAVSSTMFPVDYDFGQDSIPCGKPYEDIKVFIWDEQGRPLPPDHEGEIVVYGDALAHGYINNPELTNARFIPDPDHPGWQYFKTADLGKLRSDGQLVHLGRIDNMVKIRGIRIEMESIENYLLSYPGVVQVASRAFEDKNNNKRLAVYYLSEDGAHIPVSDLRKHLADRLPSAVLPHYIIGLDKFPMTINGKVATSQLPPPQMVRPPLTNEYVAPADDLEKHLVAIWEDQIGISGIGVTDDFFEIGGDSLVGAILFAAIKEILGKDLPVSTLLTAPTIRKQAGLIRKGVTAENYSSIIPINAKGNRVPLFFVPGKGGYPTRIRHLAKRIDLQTPVYALQDLGNIRRKGAARSVEAMATHFLKEIKKLYPHGPYIFVGESSGGKVAYEMAQQSLKAGERVPIIVMFDTYNMEESVLSGYLKKKNVPYYEMLIKKHINILVKSDWQGKLDYMRFYRETGRQKVEEFVGRRIGRPKETRGVAVPGNAIEIERINQREMRKYQVPPYPGRVILFKAMRGLASKNPTNGWERVALGELVIHRLDCYHGSILFEPAVGEVADILQNYLDEISV